MLEFSSPEIPKPILSLSLYSVIGATIGIIEGLTQVISANLYWFYTGTTSWRLFTPLFSLFLTSLLPFLVFRGYYDKNSEARPSPFVSKSILIIISLVLMGIHFIMAKESWDEYQRRQIIDSTEEGDQWMYNAIFVTLPVWGLMLKGFLALDILQACMLYYIVDAGVKLFTIPVWAAMLFFMFKERNQRQAANAIVV